MSENKSLVLVVGGTGQVGSAVVRALSRSGTPTRVLTRDPESKKSQALAALPGVELVRGDLSDPAAVATAVEGARAAFLGSSNSLKQAELETNFIKAADASPTCRYVVKLGTCGAEGYTGKESKIMYGRFHAEIEENLAASSLRWTVLRPNGFVQNHHGDFGTLPRDVIVYPVPPELKCRMIDVRDVGEIAAALLLLGEPGPHHGQLYDLSGPDGLSIKDLAALYSEVTGRQITPVEVSKEEWAEKLKLKGCPAWLADDVSISYSDFWGGGKLDYPSSKAVLQLHTPQRTLRQWIEEHRASIVPSEDRGRHSTGCCKCQ